MNFVQQGRPGRFLTEGVLHLLILNGLVHISVMLFGGFVVREPFGDNLFEKLGSFFPGTVPFKPWQVITHMFTHGDNIHLMFNMFALWMFGIVLENKWGRNRFLFFYITCGLGAYILHMLVIYLQAKGSAPQTFVVGASGAIYGLLLAFAYLFPNQKLIFLLFPVPIKAKYFVAILLVVEFYLGLQRFDWDFFAHFAHLGGALTGLVLVWLWQRNRKQFY